MVMHFWKGEQDNLKGIKIITLLRGNQRKWNKMKVKSWLVVFTCSPTFELQTSSPDRWFCIPEWRKGRTWAWRALPCGIWHWKQAKSLISTQIQLFFKRSITKYCPSHSYCQRLLIFDTSAERKELNSNSKAGMKEQTGWEAAADHQVPLEIVHTLLGHPVLEGTHALDHLTFHLRWAVNVIHWQEVLWN